MRNYLSGVYGKEETAFTVSRFGASLLHEEAEWAPVFAAYFFAAPPMLEGHAEHGLEAWRWGGSSAHGEYLSSGEPLTPPVP